MPPSGASAAEALSIRLGLSERGRGIALGSRQRVEAEPRARIATGLAALDVLLGGGVPARAVTELVGPGSSGRTALAYATLAAVTARGGWAAYVDLPDALDPEYACAAGVALARVLWVRPPDPRAAFRAAEQVLDAGGFGLVVLDLDTRVATRWRAPVSAWLRLGRAARRSGAAVVTLGRRPAAGTFAAMRLEITRRHATFVGAEGPVPMFGGLTGLVALGKNRLGRPHASPARLYVAA